MAGNYDNASGPKERAELIGAFHKSLPHDEFGEVAPADFKVLRQACNGALGKFETVARGYDETLAPPVVNPAQAPFVMPFQPNRPKSDKFVNPQGGFADDRLGPKPSEMKMLPPPAVGSASIAAEMTELYWMALLRDVPIADLASHPDAALAVDDLRAAFQRALDKDTAPGALKLGQDLPKANGKLDLTAQTLFRCGLPHETDGPLVSQFFLHDAPYGAQLIVQKQRPYAKTDYLTDVPSWLLAQNSGWDVHKIGYGDDRVRINSGLYEELQGGAIHPRRIATMRDIARFVNRDALHQAYFTATLLLLDWGAPLDDGNPYNSNPGKPHYERQAGFGGLGGPHLLSLVSEVAAKALRVVWYQKWAVWRRLRPEAFGGLAHMQKTRGQVYGLDEALFATQAAGKILDKHGGYLLPMAFPSGSPVHPAYGAGHACVAGACVTILKAWFDEDKRIDALLHDNNPVHPFTGAKVAIVQPDAAGSDVLPPYGGPTDGITVGGELNKIACNVAMGRSMGGVHFRSDNTRSLRLGERVAAFILAGISTDFPDTLNGKKVAWTFTSFSGKTITIARGKVNGKDPATLCDADL